MSTKNGKKKRNPAPTTRGVCEKIAASFTDGRDAHLRLQLHFDVANSYRRRVEQDGKCDSYTIFERDQTTARAKTKKLGIDPLEHRVLGTTHDNEQNPGRMRLPVSVLTRMCMGAFSLMTLVVCVSNKQMEASCVRCRNIGIWE